MDGLKTADWEVIVSALRRYALYLGAQKNKPNVTEAEIKDYNAQLIRALEVETKAIELKLKSFIF